MFLNLSRAASLALLLLTSGCASLPRRADGETITLSLSPGLCAGQCPHYRIVVHPDGRVMAWDLVPPPTQRSFRVSAGEAARFRELLAPFRPSGEPEPIPNCYYDNGEPDKEPVTVAHPEIEIVWSGTPPARLLGCVAPPNPALNNAIYQAVEAVHFDYTFSWEERYWRRLQARRHAPEPHDRHARAAQ